MSTVPALDGGWRLADVVVLLLATVALAGTPNVAESPAFRAFVEESKSSGSTALYIVQEGKVLVDWHRGRERPAKLMSCTKSIVAVLVGQLLDSGQIESLDRPLSTWYPEVAGQPLADVTLRNLLTMTSGLEPCDDTSDTRRCGGFGPDRIGFALASKMVQPIGTWEYNNNAINLISGVVQRVTGRPMDEYAATSLFAPLGITSAEWGRDEAGATAAESGLSMSARDLARVGEMMLAKGTWNGTRIVSTSVLDELTRPLDASPWFAQLWWPVYVPRPAVTQPIFDYWRAKGVDSGTLASLQPLIGNTWRSGDQAMAAEVAALGGGTPGLERYRALAFRSMATWDVVADTAGYSAQGYLGQYLVVLPASHVVAVRQRGVGRIFQEYDNDKRDLSGWPERVAAIFAE